MYQIGLSSVAVSEALEQAAIAAWRTLHGEKALVATDNNQFIAKNSETWLQIAVRLGASEPHTFSQIGYTGGNIQSGSLFLTVYGPAWKGFQVLRQDADTLRAVFVRACVAGVQMIRSDGPHPIQERSYWGEQVIVGFQYWEVANGNS